jgi:hypothetical protein
MSMARPSRDLPTPPRSLRDEDAADLSARAEAALARQRRALAESVDSALGLIPLPLRIPVRKVLGL